MKLNTKKGGIELHADEKRVLERAIDLAAAIKHHGSREQIEAGDDVIMAVKKLQMALKPKEDGE